MKNFLVIMTSVFMITACNLNEGIKETGESISKGVDNLVEGAKDTPKAIGDASNKAAEGGEDAVKE
jgi:hypothetical protein